MGYGLAFKPYTYALRPFNRGGWGMERFPLGYTIDSDPPPPLKE